MLYIIGLGLADERDISTKGLDIVRKAERVYLEAYTAVLLVDKEVLVRPTFFILQRLWRVVTARLNHSHVILPF